MIKAVINHMSRIMPGFPFIIDQYARFNYDRDSWWDIFKSKPAEAFRILREYYLSREENFTFIVYEISRILVSKNYRVINKIVDAVKRGEYELIDRIMNKEL